MTVAGISTLPHHANRPGVGSAEAIVAESLASVCDAGQLTTPDLHPRSRNARGVPSMVDYTIAALPTLYRGRMYRSRLEARWAAFFDRLGWAYEYEPFDLGSWSPDFLLTEQNVLVEIKPLTEFDQGVADKMLDATAKMRSNDEACGLLLPRAAPLQTAEWPTSLGWLWVPHAPDSATLTFHEAMLVWRTARRKPTMFADTATRGDDALWTMSGDCFPIKGTVFDGWRVYEAHALRLWADAANAVQWEPRQ